MPMDERTEAGSIGAANLRIASEITVMKTALPTAEVEGMDMELTPKVNRYVSLDTGAHHAKKKRPAPEAGPAPTCAYVGELRRRTLAELQHPARRFGRRQPLDVMQAFETQEFRMRHAQDSRHRARIRLIEQAPGPHPCAIA